MPCIDWVVSSTNVCNNLLCFDIKSKAYTNEIWHKFQRHLCIEVLDIHNLIHQNECRSNHEVVKNEKMILRNNLSDVVSDNYISTTYFIENQFV